MNRTLEIGMACSLLLTLRNFAIAQHEDHEHMTMTGMLGLPHQRNASGTSWQPDSTPMYAVSFSARDWRFMLHWNLHVGYDHQSSDRGDDIFMSANWLMLMVEHSLFGGELGLRMMLSADPATMGKKGYPLLLQSGESLDGIPIHDRQHPHDVFMEVAALYTKPMIDSVALQFYGGAVGEPALGPPAFPHRVSAMSDPLAPIGHHWQDSSHITFGVITLGVLTRLWKVEGSWFNGRESNDKRYDFDFRKLDSASGRFTINPTEQWSFQSSYGYLDSPEELEPDVSLQRITASAIYNRRFGDGNWAMTTVWGRNVPSKEATTDSLLVESNFDIDGSNVVFGRGEIVAKMGKDLAIPPPMEDATFTIGSISLGYERNFGPLAWLVPAVGVRGALNFIGERLRPFYGTRVPAGFMVFLHVRPSEMKMHEMSHRPMKP